MGFNCVLRERNAIGTFRHRDTHGVPQRVAGIRYRVITGLVQVGTFLTFRARILMAIVFVFHALPIRQ